MSTNWGGPTEPPTFPPRRRHVRRPVSLWAVELDNGSRYFHQILNLSRSGFFVRQSIPRTIGSHFPFELALPTGHTALSNGLIVRGVPEGPDAGAGVVMIGIAPDDELAIDGYLAALL